MTRSGLIMLEYMAINDDNLRQDDFEEQEDTDNSTTVERTSKKLKRNPDDVLVLQEGEDESGRQVRVVTTYGEQQKRMDDNAMRERMEQTDWQNYIGRPKRGGKSKKENLENLFLKKREQNLFLKKREQKISLKKGGNKKRRRTKNKEKKKLIKQLYYYSCLIYMNLNFPMKVKKVQIYLIVIIYLMVNILLQIKKIDMIDKLD